MFSLWVLCTPCVSSNVTINRASSQGLKKKRAGALGTETSTYMSEVLALAVVPLRHKAVNSSLVKFLGLRCYQFRTYCLMSLSEMNRFPLIAIFRGSKMA